jgi:anaerobic glycerol-3-phosphate dehydrogenase
LNNSHVAEDLKQSVYLVDNLYDREADKLERVEARFERVEKFLDYLKDEENHERTDLHLNTTTGVFNIPIVDPIREQYQTEREWIRRRIIENRERYADEVIFETQKADALQLDTIISAETTDESIQENTGEQA